MGHAIILASPFLIGLVWGFISPFFVQRLAGRFETKLNQELTDAGYQERLQAEPAQPAPGLALHETKDGPAPPETGDGPAATDAKAKPVEAVAATVEADRCAVIPLPTRPANLRTYVEWLVDTPQLLPTILLCAAGVAVAIAEARHVLLTCIVCGVAALIGIVVTICIMRMNPQEYSGVFRIGIFTIGALIAILINVAAAAIIIAVAA